jgi:hypothetical protein
VEVPIAGRGAPSFLKRQKEMNRAAKANAKRAAQQARRDQRAAGVLGESPLDEILLPLDEPARPDADDSTEPARDPGDDPAPA